MKALDERARVDHPYLSGTDQCWCLAEYVPGCGYRRGAVNQWISNLKYTPSSVRQYPRRGWYKRRAIGAVAALLRQQVRREWAEHVTWVPIPPSRAADDCDYDNRLTQILHTAFGDYDVDIRTVLYQVVSTTPDYARVRRRNLDELYLGLRVNWAAIDSRPLSRCVVLFDDVLTTGKHFRCCERRLHRALPHVRVAGLFIARRALSGRGRRMP